MFPSLLFAQYTGSGYYRVSNYSSGRDIWIVDCTGGIVGTSADSHAIQLKNDKEGALSSPKTIIYIDDLGNGYFNLSSQGTGIYQILSYYVSIGIKDSSRGIMTVEASKGGLNFSLGDEGKDYGFGYTSLTIYGKSTNNRWVATPVSSNSDNYFGVKPTIQSNGKFYAPFYADFAFKFASSGMKAYTISDIDNSISAAIIKEVTTDIIPARTPVLIECSSSDISNNRLDILKSNASPISGNKLSGNFFNYDEMEDYKSCPGSITEFNSESMRVFNINENGNLVLSTDAKTLYKDQFGDWSDVNFLQPNTSYLPVASDTPEELRIITAEEYEEYKAQVNAEKAKEANQIAYQRLSAELADLKQVYQTTINKLASECADVAQKYQSSLDEILSIIEASQQDIDKKYQAILLNAESTLTEAKNIKQALMDVLTSAQNAQKEYEAEQEAIHQQRIAANQEAYDRLSEKFAKAEQTLEKAAETIQTQCPLVAADFASKLQELRVILASRRAELKKQYESISLNEESDVQIEDILELIEKTVEQARIDQESRGIHLVNEYPKQNLIYTIRGTRILDPKLPKGIYIINGKKQVTK